MVIHFLSANPIVETGLMKDGANQMTHHLRNSGIKSRKSGICSPDSFARRDEKVESRIGIVVLVYLIDQIFRQAEGLILERSSVGIGKSGGCARPFD